MRDIAFVYLVEVIFGACEGLVEWFWSVAAGESYGGRIEFLNEVDDFCDGSVLVDFHSLVWVKPLESVHFGKAVLRFWTSGSWFVLFWL